MGFTGETLQRAKIRLIIKKCHVCGYISESQKEMEQCKSCKKSFLPLNYFDKIHAKDKSVFADLFAYSRDIDEEDIIKGLVVLW